MQNDHFSSISALIPSDSAKWETIERFALTSDGYALAGDEGCGNLANATRAKYEVTGVRYLQTLSVNELRCCLFFEQRRHRHMNEVPNHEDLHYIRDLVRHIRLAVKNKK